MKPYFFTLLLKTKMDVKSSEVYITYYIVPLIFFFVMGTVFTSTMPETTQTLIASMTIFTVTMGAFIGTPTGILEYIGQELRKTFRSVGIPMHTILSTTVLSGFINLALVSATIYVLGPIVYSAEKPSSQGIYLLGLAGFIITTLLLGVLIGLVGRTSSKVTILSQGIFLPSMMLSGIMFPHDLLPKPLEYIGMLLPATHGMKVLTGEEIWMNHFLILIIMSAVTLLLIRLTLKRLEKE